MKVTSISIKKIESSNSRLLGFAEIVLDDSLKIVGIRIIKGDNKIFAAMPNERLSDGKYKDYVYPITKELREEIDNSIKEAYNKEEM